MSDRLDKVVEWVDGYSRPMEELTETVWLRKIEDPKSRWYKGGEEYKLLFRFANCGATDAASESPTAAGQPQEHPAQGR